MAGMRRGEEMAYAIGMRASGAASSRAVAAWLLTCATMVFVMVILGGLTRLTDSGLSMMHWKPLEFLPPMSDEEWLFWFEQYKTIPQYKNLFPDMTLAGFKGIFWLEYIHRLWGRIIGIAFFVPLVWFVVRGAVDKPLARKLFVLFVLGGLQGALGWYMVASGFSQDVAVSQYRLAAHFSLAVALYGALLWFAFDLMWPRAQTRLRHAERLRRRHLWLMVFACVTIVSGAFVAGLDAGMIYNTFPLMGGSLVPPDVLYESPWWINFFDNMATVQFTHRVLATTLFVAIVAVWYAGRAIELPPRARLAANLVPVAALLQVALGISTLLLVVPTSLAAAHQGGALVLFTVLLWVLHELRARG